MSDEYYNAEVLEAYYEDDGSALWFDIGIRDGAKTRFQMTAENFGMLMQQLGDLAYQVREAQNNSINTHAISALKSFGEAANSALGGANVIIKYQVTQDGTEQAFAVPVGRAIELAEAIKEQARQAVRSANAQRH